ncbi:TPA: hypothetical protein ACQTWV_000370 [Enterobacter roggenkampii]
MTSNLDEVDMKILIGRWESGGDWKSVILGLFESEEIAKDTEQKFQIKHEGHNYYKTEYVDVELNKPLPF